MRRILLAIGLVLCGLGAARGQYDFGAECPEGQVLYFRILSDSVSVGVTHPGPNWPYYAPEHRLRGAVTVPQEVEWRGRRYRVAEVDDNAFYRNDSLTAIVLPPVRRIGSQAFCDCAMLAEVNLPDGLVEIGDGAFAGCRSMVSVSLPSTLRRVGTSAFSMCDGLRSVALGAGLHGRLDSSVFMKCMGIDEGKNAEKRPDGTVFLVGSGREDEILCR